LKSDAMSRRLQEQALTFSSAKGEGEPIKDVAPTYKPKNFSSRFEGMRGAQTDEEMLAAAAIPDTRDQTFSSHATEGLVKELDIVDRATLTGQTFSSLALEGKVEEVVEAEAEAEAADAMEAGSSGSAQATLNWILIVIIIILIILIIVVAVCRPGSDSKDEESEEE